jgi:ribosomal protein S12 methylthiotransferase
MTGQNALRRPRVALLTLGCPKNLLDSERIASVLEANGAEVVHELEGAQAAIVNTCGFIQSAKEESIDVILAVGGRRKAQALKTLVVTGCLSQRYGEELRRLLPEADVVVGIDPEGAARAALAVLMPDCVHQVRPSFPRSRRLTPAAWSYLAVSYGCDNRCAYCAIPLIRGPLRSRPRQEVLDEARFLAEQGVREVNVIAQDTAAYGVDLDGRPAVHALLRDLCRIEGLTWVRLLYVHPAHVYDELIEVLAAERKICPYVDLPIQHINDRILERMGRKTRRSRIEGLIARLRGAIPGLALRTTLMTGFPGEGEAEFDELLQFVRQVRFDRMGCFAYSPEEDTAAVAMPDQVPEHVREERCDRLMAAQQEIAFELSAARVGEKALVLTEDSVDAEGRRAARSVREAPDVDPLIYVEGEGVPEAGQFIEVQITDSAGYDSIARIAAEPPDAG